MLRAALALSVCVLIPGCVAPVQWQRVPRAPARHAFVGPHGVPRAFGAGVCAISDVHTHSYPPVPQAAFAFTERGATDTRPLYPFVDPHPHHEGSCAHVGWHLHTEPPLPSLQYDDALSAFVRHRERARPVISAAPGHATTPCHNVPCAFERPHGHAPCAEESPARKETRLPHRAGAAGAPLQSPEELRPSSP